VVKRCRFAIAGFVSRNISVPAREAGRYWIVEYREIPGLEIVLIISSSSSPTVDKAGRLGRLSVVVSILDRAALLFNLLLVTLDNVID
jgi:hypothetical protein